MPVKPNLVFTIYNIQIFDQIGLTEGMTFRKKDQSDNSSAEISDPSSQSQENSIKQTKVLREGQWSAFEQSTYLTFLKEHRSSMGSSNYMKKHRIFKKISVLLGTRTPVQVKSHHQKLKEKYKKIAKIIVFLEKKFATNEQQERDANSNQKPCIPIIFPLEIEGAKGQNESAFVGESWFDTNNLEKYIYSAFKFDEDSLFS